MRPLLNTQKLKTACLWRTFYNGKAIYFHWLFGLYRWRFNGSAHNKRIRFSSSAFLWGTHCSGVGWHSKPIESPTSQQTLFGLDS